MNKNYLRLLYMNDPISVTRLFDVVDLFMYNAYILLALNAFSKESMHYHLLIFNVCYREMYCKMKAYVSPSIKFVTRIS